MILNESERDLDCTQSNTHECQPNKNKTILNTVHPKPTPTNARIPYETDALD